MRTLVRSLLGLALLTGPSATTSASPVTPTFMLDFGSEGFQIGETSFVNGMTVDSLGNVYAVNAGTNRIQKFDALGNFLGSFGSFGTGDGQFSSAYGIVGDGAGNFYVSEHTGNRIQKVTSSGAFLLKWGSTGSGNGQFMNPRGMAIDADGNVYVCDSGNDRIQKFTAGGVYVTQWGGSGSGNGQLSFPAGIVVDEDGFVYVSEVLNHRIQKFTSSGAYVAQWGTNGFGDGEFNNPNGLALDAFGYLYVTDAANDRVQKFTPTGAYVTQWGSSGTGPGQFLVPGAMTIDAENNVYVFDANNHRVQKFSSAGASVAQWPPSFLLDLAPAVATGLAPTPAGDMLVLSSTVMRRYSPSGTLLGTFGSSGSGNGQLTGANGIATDTAGNIYVADTGNHRVQKFSAAGAYLTQWGTFGNADGQFSSPQALDVDGEGNVYVVDTNNLRIQKFTSNGVFLAKWGTSGTGNGEFILPRGIAVDRHGLVYVTDYDHHRIQKFTGDGIYIDQFGTGGGGPGQFFQARDIAIDADGFVNVVDGVTPRLQRFTSEGTFLSQLTIPSSGAGTAVAVDPVGTVYVGVPGVVKKYAVPPTVTYATDVPNDEGRRVRLRFRAASNDAATSGKPVLGYDVYLLIDSASAPGATTGESAPAQVAAYRVPATGAAEYVVDVDAAIDATFAAPEHSAYMVRAWTGPFANLDSEHHSGLSIDNLAPPMPSPFLADYGAGATRLHWDVSPAGDFTTFRLYRGTDPSFVPGPSTLLAESPDTGYVDPVQPGFTYKLSAVDDAGNESVFATLGPGGVVGVPAPGLAFGIEALRPNPATTRSAMHVRFTLPRAASAQLELVNVAGRRVTVREVGGLGAGTHAVDLAAGRPSLGSGIYFVRLVQGGDVAVRRVVLLD